MKKKIVVFLIAIASQISVAQVSYPGYELNRVIHSPACISMIVQQLRNSAIRSGGVESDFVSLSAAGYTVNNIKVFNSTKNNLDSVVQINFRNSADSQTLMYKDFNIDLGKIQLSSCK